MGEYLGVKIVDKIELHERVSEYLAKVFEKTTCISSENILDIVTVVNVWLDTHGFKDMKCVDVEAQVDYGSSKWAFNVQLEGVPRYYKQTRYPSSPMREIRPDLQFTKGGPKILYDHDPRMLRWPDQKNRWEDIWA